MAAHLRGAYGQQDAYMRASSLLPLTQQQQALMDQGGAEFMSFNNPMTGS